MLVCLYLVKSHVTFEIAQIIATHLGNDRFSGSFSTTPLQKKRGRQTAKDTANAALRQEMQYFAHNVLGTMKSRLFFGSFLYSAN